MYLWGTMWGIHLAIFSNYQALHIAHPGCASSTVLQTNTLSWGHGIPSQTDRNTAMSNDHHHDDVIKWKPFPRYWPFVRGIHRSPVNSPHKGQWRGALMFSLICVWINSWINKVRLVIWEAIGLIMMSLLWWSLELPVNWVFLFNTLFGLTTKKHQRSLLLSLCEGNPLVTGGFPAQRDSNVEYVSIWWHHNEYSNWKDDQNNDIDLEYSNGGLTHWGRATHICVSKLTIIGSDNGLSPGRRQAIIWTNAGILLIGPLGTNFNETSIKIHTFSFTKIHLKLSSGKWRLFCLGLNVLINCPTAAYC